MSDQLENLNKAAKVLQQVDVSSIITSLALGIAKAQEQLDDNSVKQILKLSQQQVGGKSLLELGFVPAFYHFEYADVSASIHLKMVENQSSSFALTAKLDYAKTKGYSKEDVEMLEKSKQEKHRKEFKSSKSILMRANESKSIKIQNKTVSIDQTKTAISKVEDFADQMRQAENISRVQTRLSSDNKLTNVNVALGAWVNHSSGYISAYVPNTAVSYGLLQIKDYPGSPSAFSTDASDDLTIATSYTTTKTNLTALQANTTWAAAITKSFYLPFKSDADNALVIYFGHDKDEKIDLNYSEGIYNNVGVLDKLTALQKLLSKEPTIKISIDAYTDSSGSINYNKALSDRRANTVLNFFPDALKKDGTKQITPNPLGETLAIAGGDGKKDPQYRKVVIKLTSTLADYIYFEGAGFTTAADTVEDLSTTNTVNGFVFKIPGVAFSGNYAFNYGNDSIALSAVTSVQDFTSKFDALSFSNNYSKETIKDTVYLLHKDTKIEYTAFNSEDKEITIEGASASENSSTLNENTFAEDDTVNSEYYLKKDAENINDPSSLAVSASVDIRTAKAHEISMEGNASVSARLRSLPPPDQFKVHILNMINGGGQ
jgi:hypothetical protein